MRMVPVLLLVAPLAAFAQTGRFGASVIARDRVGVVRIGMPLDLLRQRCPIIRDTTVMDDGETTRVVDALVAGDTVRVRVLRDTVWQIVIRRPGFATQDGIREGMPLSRFLVARRPTILIGEGKVFLLDARHRGNSFGLSAEAYARASTLTAAGLARLPRSTIIDEILVTGSSTRVPDPQ